MIEKKKLVNQEGNLATSRAAGPSTATPTSCQGILWQNLTRFLRKKRAGMKSSFVKIELDFSEKKKQTDIKMIKVI